MDSRDGARWRRVPGNRSLWVLSRRPLSVWEALRARTFSRLSVCTEFLATLRHRLGRFGRRHSRGGAVTASHQRHV